MESGALCLEYCYLDCYWNCFLDFALNESFALWIELAPLHFGLKNFLYLH